MPGLGMPTKSSTFSMPFSAIVARSANSVEKLTWPWDTSSPLASCLRSLSLAVIDTTLAPAAANFAMMVSPRSSSGPVITTGCQVAVSR
jgi:hypothetical protein